MSNLNLNIPITVEPTAMLSIHEDNIDRQVQDMYGYMTSIKSTCDNINLSVLTDGIQNAGIDITSYSITLNADKVKIGDSVLFDSGYIKTQLIDVDSIDTTYLYATKLDTKVPSGNAYAGASLHIEDGNMDFKDADGQLDIAIGIENSYAVIKFYKDNVCQYTIGPNLFYDE